MKLPLILLLFLFSCSNKLQPKTSMIFKIQASEVDAVKYVASLCDYECSIYSIEENELMKLVEMLQVNGDEIPANIALGMGRQIELKLQCDEFKSRK